MRYRIYPGYSPLAIGECEWASAQAVVPVNGRAVPTVQFSDSAFSIGIVASSADASQIVGIHLAMVGAGQDVFSVNDVPGVTALLSDFPKNRTIVGQIGLWQENIGLAFDVLVDALENARQSDQGDGIYGAGLDSAGQVQVLFQPS